MTTDKLKGCLYGFAIGDALGHGTVFMTRREAEIRYPKGLTAFHQIIHDSYRNLYPQGAYSNCTEFALLMAESMIEKSGLDADDYAHRLYEWYGKEYHLDMGAHFRWIVGNPDFLKDPYRISHQIQEAHHFRDSSNEALGRALIGGLWSDYDENQIFANTDLTNWGSLSRACAAVVSAMSHSLMTTGKEATYEEIIEIARRHDPHLIPYLEIAFDGSLEELDLDDEETYYSAPKSVGAAFWALWHNTDPVKALVEVIIHGGDAHTNGALTAALLGLKYGYSTLPEHLTGELVGRKRLDDIVEKLSPILTHHHASLD